MKELLDASPSDLTTYRQWCGQAIAELMTLADGDTRGPMNKAVHVQAAELVRRAKLFAVQLRLFPLAAKLPERELKTVLNAILQLELCRRYRIGRKQHSQLTPPTVAKRYGVSPDTVRGWIQSGELAATNIAKPGRRPQFRVTPDALAEFDRKRVAPVMLPTPPQRRRRPQLRVQRYSASQART